MVERLIRAGSPSYGVALISRIGKPVWEAQVSAHVVGFLRICMPIKDYLKYYWLENYLEKKVRPAFVKNHFLTAEQFFAIIFWKSKRPAKRIRAGFLNAVVKDLIEAIHGEEDGNAKLDILLDKDGFDIAMASAVLTILYPKIFTVYDYRVRDQLNKQIEKLNKGSKTKLENVKDLGTVSNRQEKKKLYWEYVKLVRDTDSKLSLRDCDRALWGKSWYEDLQDFIGSVEKPGRKKSEKDL